MPAVNLFSLRKNRTHVNQMTQIAVTTKKNAKGQII